MSTELTMLVASALLCVAMPVTYVARTLMMAGGVQWQGGNHDAEAPSVEWLSRLRRAHANMVENLVVFGVLVLAAEAAGQTNEWTALGAQVFFGGRVLHVVAYAGGLTPWRTVVYFVSLGGIGLVAAPLVAAMVG